MFAAITFLRSSGLLVLTLLLMVDAAIELIFVSYTVAFLHGRSKGTWSIKSLSGEGFELQGQPSKLLVNQGHTSNAAAGVALVLVGGVGLVILLRRGVRNVSNLI
jgi:hypothetical protein